ncbi:MAG: hypothetical protein WD739_07285 [Actinomycetota bacterium]
MTLSREIVTLAVTAIFLIAFWLGLTLGIAEGKKSCPPMTTWTVVTGPVPAGFLAEAS